MLHEDNSHHVERAALVRQRYSVALAWKLDELPEPALDASFVCLDLDYPRARHWRCPMQEPAARCKHCLNLIEIWIRNEGVADGALASIRPVGGASGAVPSSEVAEKRRF